MRILLIAMGSRGDVQPILALGHGLKDAGYDVVIGAGSNFQNWIDEEGFEYAPFRVNIQDMMTSDSGKEWIENSSDNPLREARNMKQMMTDYGDRISQDLVDMAQDVDVLVSGLPSFGGAESVAELLGKKHITVMLAPMIPSSNAASTMVPFVPRTDIFINRFAGYVGEYFTYWIFKDVVNKYREIEGLKPFSYFDYIRRWNNMPVLYGTSPLLLPPDPKWHDEIFVTGYWYLLQGEDWQPPQDLCMTFWKRVKHLFISASGVCRTRIQKQRHN